MNEHYAIIKKCTLFKGISDDKLPAFLAQLGAYKRTFAKNEIIRYADSEITETGILLTGAAYIAKTDIEGNTNIIIELVPGQSFGEMLAFSKTKVSPVNIVASLKSSVMFIPVKKIIEFCANATECRYKVIDNLVTFLAEKSMLLHIKNDILAQKTIREKMLCYCHYISVQSGKKHLKIPFSREELADYLSVNVSALSRELGKMREDGIIDFNKNEFKITSPNAPSGFY